MSLPPRPYLAVILLLLVLALVPACGQNALPTPTPTGVKATESPTATDTPAPTLTPTPASPVAILLAPAGADAATSAALQTMLSGLAESAGLRFLLRPSLAATELSHVRIVVAIPPDPGLAALAAAAPGTQFLAVGLPGLQPAANLSTILPAADRPDQLGFLAGYVAAAITGDWRTGVISEADTPTGKAISLGFQNGVTYLCGLCSPAYPPFPNGGYPVQVDLATSAGPEDWQASLTYLKSWQVGTAFVDPSLANEDLLANLGEAGINLILAGTPPPAPQPSYWVASLGAPDLLQAVPDAWGKLLAGGKGEQVTLPLGFTGVNPVLLSPGRQHLAERMLADLLAGLIDTGVDPATGESR